MNKIPSISVLLLCWNHAKYLEQCISSLAEQTVPPDEIVFLDNCSTDGSHDLAERLFEKFGLGARLLSNSAPQGISKNFNRLAGEATSDLIAPLSTDDWYADGYVSEMQRAASDTPTADWFYPAGWTYADDTGEIAPIVTDNFRSGNVREWVRQIDWPFGFVGVCYRRSVIAEIGGWDESLPVEDNDMMFRLGMTKTCKFVERRLIYYRRFLGTVSTNLLFCADAWDGFYRKHRSDIIDPDTKHSNMIRAYSAMAIDRGDLVQAKSLLFRAIRIAPFHSLNLRTGWYLLRAAIVGRGH